MVGCKSIDQVLLRWCSSIAGRANRFFKGHITLYDPMEKYEVIRAEALKLGADEAKIIRVDSIETGAWVKMKCRFGCDSYGSNLCCPPYSPTFKETKELLSCYEHAIMIHSIRGLHDEPHPTTIVARLEREAFLAGYYKAFAIGAGPCRICDECNLDHCVDPEHARPSMEACGIDVFKTARNNGFKIEVLTKGCEVVDRYSLVLME